MDAYLGLKRVILNALREARANGDDYTGQTGHAVRAVMAARPEMGSPRALAIVKLVRAESP